MQTDIIHTVLIAQFYPYSMLKALKEYLDETVQNALKNPRLNGESG